MYKELVILMRKKARSVGDMPARAQEVWDYFGILDSSKGVCQLWRYCQRLTLKCIKANCSQKTYQPINIGHKRFALAHELAHYLFDFDETKDLVYYNTYFAKEEEKSEIELRANAFVAEQQGAIRTISCCMTVTRYVL